MTTISYLNLNLHNKKNMPLEVTEKKLDRSVALIEKANDSDQVPWEQRDVRVQTRINEVFNLMAVKIQMHADARKRSALKLGNETRKFKTRPNVIYIKGPRDRLLMMTESVD